MGPRKSLSILVVAMTLFGLAAWGASEGSDYQVIVNPQNPISEVSADLLRDAYLKKAIEWPDGETMRPIDLSSRFAQRDRFTHDVLHKTAAQLKAYWNQQIFSGKGVPPPEADAVADVIAYVIEHPGAVAYIPARMDAGRAKVVRIK